ncbi:MAG: rRNA pseudouridine synthase [Firmicutes bacterium]|nr:rRNA pseudouridine synthase [Bacillota bacterium]
MRLQKFLAAAGVASRRKSEEYIKDGRVKLNGETVSEMGISVDEEKDIVEFDGKKVTMEEKNVYILLNKPVGYVTTAKDQFGRKTVLDLIDGVSERVYPVGRLDYDTEGLLLLTNDGELTYKLTHPKHRIEKTYIAHIEGVPSEDEMKRFCGGLKIEDYVTSRAEIEIIRKKGKESVVKIVIGEGRNRQVRKMCACIGHEVKKLKRIKEGNIELGDVKCGQWRFLSDEEIASLKN